MIRHLTTEITLTLRILFRQPGFWIPTVLFPAMLYAFFGANSGGGTWAANAMASFAIYAVLGVGFFQFGVSVAQDRATAFARWQRSASVSSSNRKSAEHEKGTRLASFEVIKAIVSGRPRLVPIAWAISYSA